MNIECKKLVLDYGYSNDSKTVMKFILLQALYELRKGLSLAKTKKFLGIKKLLCPDCSQKNQPTALMKNNNDSLFCCNCMKTWKVKS